jgi:hypothetical protein
MPCVASEKPTPGAYCACCGLPARAADADWIAAIDPSSIRFRGFVRDERFNRGSDQVIKGTNRAKSRAWRKIAK